MKLPTVKGVRTIGFGAESTKVRPSDLVIVKRNAYENGAYSIHLTDNADETKMKSDSVLGVSRSKQAATEFANQVKQLNGLAESNISKVKNIIREMISKKK